MIKKYWPLILVLLISFSLTIRLFRSGLLSSQDDLHLFRLSQYYLCLKSADFPCRYSPDSALGYGSPVFNFYPPLTYFIGSIFHFFGISLIDSLKLLFILPLFFGPIFMYLLIKDKFGRNNGVISAILFATAPYQALNIFVRGALAEHFALNLVPIIFYFFIKNKNKAFIFFLSALLLTHQLTSLWTLFLLLIFSLSQKKLIQFSKSAFASFLLSAFFLLPSFFEKNLTTNETMIQGYFQYHIHFATLKQLFLDRFWGYGASLWGPVDDMSFQIGYFQWFMPSVIFIYYLIFKRDTLKKYFPFIFLSFFFLFLTHNRSTFIWKSIPFMAYFQFPWRFLGPAIFLLSISSGFLKLKTIFLIPLVAFIFISNFSFFKEDIWYPNLTDSEKLSGQNLIAQSGAGLKDYWPNFSVKFPETHSYNQPQVISGVTSQNLTIKSSHQFYGYIVSFTQNSTIDLPIAYFPNMSLLLNGEKTNYRINPQNGLIEIDIPEGVNYYLIKFYNTPVRVIANFISIFALFFFIIKIIRDQT